jgi:hypothetical protein
MGIAAALAVGILLAGTGIAFAGFADKSKTTTIPAGGKGYVTARCPKGSEVVSGGFQSDSGGGNILGFLSSRTSSRAWKVGGWDVNEDAGGSFTAHATCTKRHLGLVTKSAGNVLGSEEQGGAIAACPRGSRVVSGGYTAPFHPSLIGSALFVFTSKRVGVRKWKAAAANNGGAKGTLRAFAYCDKPGPRLVARSKSVAIPEPEQPARATATCPTGLQVYSGGFQDTNYGSGVGQSEIVPFESFRVNKQKWVVGGRNFIDGGTLVAHVYCGR